MKYIEQSIRPDQPVQTAPAKGLGENERNRLGSQFRFRQEVGTKVLGVAEGIVPAALSGVRALLIKDHSSRLKSGPVDKLPGGDKERMTAVHLMSIAGYDSDCGPVDKDGNRSISTKYPDLLVAVVEELKASTVEAHINISPIFIDKDTDHEKRMRNWTVSQVMDEVSASMFDALRSDPEIQSKKTERQKAAGQPVTLFERDVA